MSPRSYSQHFIRFPLLSRPFFVSNSILSSLMSKRPLEVSPFLTAAHSTSSEEFDFQICYSPVFLMQSRQARQDSFRCIARPNSSSASILLWTLSSPASFLRSFRHHFKTIGRTELANVEQTQKMIPFITCEISLGQYACELVHGVNYLIWILGSKLILSNNQSRATLWVLETCLIVGLLPFIIYNHLDHCFVVFKDMQ